MIWEGIGYWITITYDAGERAETVTVEEEDLSETEVTMGGIVPNPEAETGDE